MIVRLLREAGVTSRHLRGAAYAAGGVSLVSWMRAKSLDQSLRDHAEYRSVFVGLWAPTLWVMSHSVRRDEQRRRRSRFIPSW